MGSNACDDIKVLKCPFDVFWFELVKWYKIRTA